MAGLMARPGALILVVLLVLAGIVGAIVAINPGTMLGDFDTNGKIGHKNGYNWKNVNSRDKFILSWDPSEDSEQITVQAFASKPAAVTFDEPDNYRYVVYVEGTKVKESITYQWPDYFLPGATYNPLNAWSFEIQSGNIGDGARMQITIYVKWHNVVDGSHSEGEISGCHDDSYLESGYSSISLYPDKSPYEEGSKATFLVTTGYTRGSGYELRVVPPVGRTDLTTMKVANPGDDERRTYDITIQAGWFKVGTVEDNTFRVELWSAYFLKNWEILLTVDSLLKAPKTPSMQIVEGSDKVAFTINLYGEATFSAIKGFKVWAWYGDTQGSLPPEQNGEAWILYDATASATVANGKNYTASIGGSIKTFKDGLVQIRIYSYDVEGRASPFAYGQMKVIKGEIGDHDDNTPPHLPFIWSVLVILIIAIGAALGAGLGYLWREKPLVAIAIFAISTFVAFAIAWVVGTSQYALVLGGALFRMLLGGV